jgi:hypothetical protein
MMADALDLGRRKHMIHGLLEIDVAAARQPIREYEATARQDLSTAFVVACSITKDSRPTTDLLPTWGPRLNRLRITRSTGWLVPNFGHNA